MHIVLRTCRVVEHFHATRRPKVTVTW